VCHIDRVGLLGVCHMDRVGLIGVCHIDRFGLIHIIGVTCGASEDRRPTTELDGNWRAIRYTIECRGFRKKICKQGEKTYGPSM
jgi:hypothetical protein